MTGRGLAIPGLVDLQVNGYAGVDVLDAEPGELVEMGRALARDGVLWYQPTLVTSPLEETLAALQSVGQAYELGGSARILGAHLEGPFLSPARVGRAPGRAAAHARSRRAGRPAARRLPGHAWSPSRPSSTRRST